MKTILLALALLAAMPQRELRAGEKGDRHVAAGYVYNSREDYHGAWVESGFRVFRGAELATAYSKFADPYRYQEVSAALRVPLLRIQRFEGGPEAGYAIGSYTDTDGDQAKGGVTRTWLAGAAAQIRIGSGWSWQMRCDLVNPRTGGYKDDRLRMHFGLRFDF